MGDAVAMASAIEGACLPSIVSACLHVDAVAGVSVAACDALSGGLSGGHVYRVSGTADVDGQTMPWSLVVKVFHRTEASGPQDSPYYWLRERDVAASRLAAEMPDGLSAARRLGVTDRSPDEVWLWFEDLGGEPERLTAAAWATIARGFGRWQGPYLLGKPVPSHPWLARRFIERWCIDCGPVELSQHASNSLLQRMYPAGTAAVAERFWHDRERFLAAYRRLPLAVTHIDAFWRNLFPAKGGAVAIDWALTGIEPVGAELNSLIFTNIVSQEVEAEAYDAFDRGMFAAYVAGLRDGGGCGPARTHMARDSRLHPGARPGRGG